jgi:hypothetical protein
MNLFSPQETVRLQQFRSRIRTANSIAWVIVQGLAFVAEHPEHAVSVGVRWFTNDEFLLSPMVLAQFSYRSRDTIAKFLTRAGFNFPPIIVVPPEAYDGLSCPDCHHWKPYKRNGLTRENARTYNSTQIRVQTATHGVNAPTSLEPRSSPIPTTR